MDFGIWLVAVNLSPIAAVGVLAFPRLRFASPWLGLATVVVGTLLAFSSSNTLARDVGIGVGIGWPVTSFYSLVGLVIVVGYVRLRPIPFVPIGAIVAGLVHVASNYAFLPPFDSSLPSFLVFSTPGFALIAYGVVLWRTHGIAGSMRDRSLSLRLALTLVSVVGLGAIGLLNFQTDRNDPGPWFSRLPDLPRLASTSELVVEGVIIHKAKASHSYKGQSVGRNSTVVHTLYAVEVHQFWRGTEAETVYVAIQDYSPVNLAAGQRYLLFSGGMVSPRDLLPGYWHLVEPVQAWTVDDSGFHPYPGLVPAAPVSRQELAEVLARNPAP